MIKKKNISSFTAMLTDDDHLKEKCINKNPRQF